MKKYPKKYSKEIEDHLKSLVDNFHKEELAVRQRQLRTWRRLKLLWENIYSTYYDEVAHEWRVPQNSSETNDQEFYDKPINVLRAYLESIIAALSVTIPAIKCYPDDADNYDDILTAKAGDNISKLIYRHNDTSLLWIHSLFVYCTEGLTFCYNYSKSDKEYGTFVQKKYESKLEKYTTATCPECGFESEIPESEFESPEIDAGPEMDVCLGCGSIVIPEINTIETEVNVLIKEEHVNKTRQCLEAYGGLNIEVPSWARRQEECLYLIYNYETHYANALEYYPHLYGEIDTGIFDPYEVWARLSPQYRGEYPENNVTCRHAWLRPAAFNTLPEQEMKKLRKLFPNGVRVDLVNDTYAGAEPESLDDCWTLTKNPLSDYIHNDPIGLLLTSVQEITNDLISLTLQTIEHGIGQTFADPGVIDFQGYRQLEAQPGNIFPAKAKAGKSLGDGFHEIKTATLSQEVMPFGQEVQNLGQLVSGALPSLFGGAMQEQKTASGYAMSRAQALQRLQNTWKMFTTWWKTIFSKAIPKYIASIEEDERTVEQDVNGNFINVFIRRSQLMGKIGRYELEANENLPITWSQRKDVIMQLLTTNNELILQTLAAPENLPIIREAIGLDDFYVPGEHDRNKTYNDIQLMLMAAPTPIGMGPMGEMIEGPSIEIDPDIDNLPVVFDICRTWLTGDAGQLAKVENPEGYKNVLLYAKQAKMFLNMMMAPPPMENGAPGEKPKETDKEAPIEGEADVNAQA